MSRRVWLPTLGIAVAVLVTLGAPAAMAQGRTVTRPISDWIAAQGSMTAAGWAAALGYGFIASYVAWTGRTGPHEDIGLLMVVDYAGLDAEAVEVEVDSGGAVTVPTKLIEITLSKGRELWG